MSDGALTPEESAALRAAADGAVRATAADVQLAASDRHARRALPMLKEKMTPLLHGTKAVVVRLLRRPCQVTASPLEIAGPMAMQKEAASWLLGAVITSGQEAEPLAWVGLPPMLGYHLIEIAFGAPPVVSKTYLKRDFVTPLEHDTLWPSLESFARSLVRSLGLEHQPALRIAPLAYPIVLDNHDSQESGVSFHAELRLGEELCEVSFLLAPKALDVMHAAALGGDDADKRERAANNMLAHLAGSEVTLVANLGTTEVTVATLAELGVGQMIWLDRVKSTPVDVVVEGQPKFTAMPMQRAGALGVQIVSRIE